jgi:hypothetical protein
MIAGLSPYDFKKIMRAKIFQENMNFIQKND